MGRLSRCVRDLHVHAEGWRDLDTEDLTDEGLTDGVAYRQRDL